MRISSRILLAATICCAAAHAQQPGFSFERPGAFTELPARPRAGASQAFWERWGDGKAELSGYRAKVGVYPYSVQTCVYSPVEPFLERRFAPVKLTLTAQEWCGNEDALPIQLRELDGPFADGKDWRGKLVPSLWRQRAGQLAPGAQPASIERRERVLDGRSARSASGSSGRCLS